MKKAEMRPRALAISLIILSVLAILAPLFILPIYAIASPPIFDETFVGALEDKYERLYSIEGKKIVVIGGSSVAFGLDSPLLSAELARLSPELGELPVVNFGLYATLGSKLMLDLSRDAIGEGDIVIFAPETDPQAWSLYFSASSTWQALDGAAGMLFDIGTDDYDSLWGGLFAHSTLKLKYQKSGKPQLGNSIYRRDSFNEYGDIANVPRRGLSPAMRLYGYDRTTPITLSSSIVSPDFVEFLNEYIEDCEKKGATVLLSFSPMNRGAVLHEKDAGGNPINSEASIRAFAEYLSSAVACPLISDPNDYIMTHTLFYDSNFHLNDAGVEVRTKQLAEDIAAYLNNS